MMEAQSDEFRQRHGGPVLGTLDLLVAILSYLQPFDAIWCREVCRWWHRLIRHHELGAQILRNNACTDFYPRIFRSIRNYDYPLCHWIVYVCVCGNNSHIMRHIIINYCDEVSMVGMLKLFVRWFRDDRGEFLDTNVLQASVRAGVPLKLHVRSTHARRAWKRRVCA
jgi:hypothetical protein